MINLRSIEVFYTIMRAGSITEAAKVLNVTQPAVSVALKQLEARMKIKLFERSGGRLQPTPEAKALFPDVAEIFSRVNAVEKFSRDLARGSRGVFTVAATLPLCDGFVAKAVARFVKQRTGVRINVQGLASMVVLDRVISREVDVGVVYEPVVSAAVEVEELSHARIGCVMPAKHALARRRTVAVEDLVPYPVVTYLPQALLRPYVDHLLNDRASGLNVAVLTGNSSTALSLAREGAGLAIIETALFEANPIPGFVMRDFAPVVRLKVLMLRPCHAVNSPVLQDFITELRSSFSKEGVPRHNP